MAATPKHRRSSSKKRSTRASQRYDVVVKKSRIIKKSGGQFLQISKETGKYSPSHTVSVDNPTYRGLNLIKPSKKK